MKKFLLILFALVLVGTVAIHALANNQETLRYKVTVTVQTPEGVKTGYAVREAGRYSEMRILPQQGGTTYNILKGEAVVVDLGKRGILFELIGEREIPAEPQLAFKLLAEKGETGCLVLTPEQYPIFAHFTDLKDPKTVEGIVRTNDLNKAKRADPYSMMVDFESAFGRSVYIKEITIEITNEPVTWGIEKWLPWLPGTKDVPGVLGSTPGHPVYTGSLGLTGIEFIKGRFW
jgi:hypothetical protein